MKKILFLIVVSMLLFNQTASGNEQTNLKHHFLNKIDEVIMIVKDRTLQKDERNSDIVKALTPMFDFELMAKISLGKVWKQLDSKDQKRFVNLYIKRMKKSYSSKIDGYKDEKVEVKDIIQPKNNRIKLVTDLASQTDTLKISYKFYKPRTQKKNKDKWLIYDAVILGVSILKTDKVQFHEFLQTKDIYALMSELEKK